MTFNTGNVNFIIKGDMIMHHKEIVRLLDEGKKIKITIERDGITIISKIDEKFYNLIAKHRLSDKILQEQKIVASMIRMIIGELNKEYKNVKIEILEEV